MLAFIALVGCDSGPPVEDAGRDEPAGPPVNGGTDPGLGTLRVGLSVDPISIDPRFVADDEGTLIVGALFDPLVRLGADGQVLPGAASTWELQDDGRTYRFTLREDATFHDGTPVTAADVKRSFERLVDADADPPSFLGYLLEPVEGAARAALQGGEMSGLIVDGDHELRIRLVEPHPAFLLTLTDPSLVPLPPIAERSPEDFAARPIGNGPFAMAEPREPGGFVRLAAVQNHPRRPVLDEVLFQVFLDDPAGLRQWDDLLDGQLQVAALPPSQREEAIEQFGLSEDGYRGPGVLDGITSSVYLYGFDTSQPPYDDARVRRAISSAIDREALAEVVMRGLRAPAEGLVPPPVTGSQLAACSHCRHDPEAARQLIAEVQAERVEAAVAEAEAARTPTATSDVVGEDDRADGADDAPPSIDPDDLEIEPVLTSVTISHSRSPTHAAIAERVAADLEAALGLDVVIEARELPDHLTAIRAGEAPLFRFGWQTNEPSFSAYLDPMFHSREVGRDNLTGFANEEVDELLDLARSQPDLEAANRFYRAAERRLLDEAPALPLLWYRHALVVAEEVEGLVYTAFGRLDLSAVSLAED